jgi:CRP/FNR family cyclic AMP-dependent transcriptional regulator
MKPKNFYLIQSGKVALETFVPGCGMVTIQTLGAGEALGWSWLFPPRKWHFSASASEPTELIQFDAEWLRDKAEENREFRCELITCVAQILLARLQGTRMQLIDLFGMRP